ncbi:MAG: protein-glutamate O-methyltransferase CheR [Gammaproteobacteria bacterium]|nr:protein-glutamate O-methyltransferase CheR [Gammaproteobacteria bacterium]
MTSPATAYGQEAPQEYAFNDAHFELLRKLVGKYAGISLNDTKRQLVYGRLARRIRAMNLGGFDEYCELVRDENSDEIENFINAITTNLTSFFRENHHFECLVQQVVPTLLKTNAATRRIRVWSAGCSTGEEPYSIAMALSEALGNTSGWDVKILATDIDSNVVATAAAGIYPANRQQGVSDARLKRFFMPAGGAPGSLRLKDEVRGMIRFAPLNLMEPWPFKGPFDVIFCRNVVIYFDKETQGRLFGRYADVLARHGYLFIGHSETMFGTCTRFDLIGRTTYRLAGMA